MVKKLNHSPRATAVPSHSTESTASPEASSPPTPRTRARLKQFLKAPYKLLTGIIWGTRTPSNIPFEAQVAPVPSTGAVAANAGGNPQPRSTQESGDAIAGQVPAGPSQGAIEATAPQYRQYTPEDYDADYRREADKICKAVKSQDGDFLNNEGIGNQAARARHHSLLEVLHENGVDLLKEHEGHTPLQEAEFELRCLEAAQGAKADRPPGYRAPMTDYRGLAFKENHSDRERALAYSRRVKTLEGNIAFLKNLERSKLTESVTDALNRCTPKKRSELEEQLRGKTASPLAEKTESPPLTIEEARHKAVRDLLAGTRSFGDKTDKKIPAKTVMEATHIAIDWFNKQAAHRQSKAHMEPGAGVTGSMPPVQSSGPAKPNTPPVSAREKESPRMLTERAKVELQAELDRIVKAGLPGISPMPVPNIAADLPAEATMPAENALQETFKALNKLLASQRGNLSDALGKFIETVSNSENTDFDVSLRFIVLPDRNNVRKVSANTEQLDRLLAIHIVRDNPREAKQIVEYIARIVNSHQGEAARFMQTRHALPQAAHAVSLQEQMGRLGAKGAEKARAHDQSKLIDTVLNLVPDVLSVDEAATYLKDRVTPICVQSDEVVQGLAKEMLLARFNQRFPGSLDPGSDRTKLLIPLERALLGSRGKKFEGPSTLFQTMQKPLDSGRMLERKDVKDANQQDEAFAFILSVMEQEIKENGFSSPTLGATQRATLFGDPAGKKFSDSQLSQETPKNALRVSLDVYGRVTDALEAWEVLHSFSQQIKDAEPSTKIAYFHELRHRIKTGKEMASAAVQDEMLIKFQQVSIIEEFRELEQEKSKITAREKWISLSHVKEAAIMLLNKRLTEAASQQAGIVGKYAAPCRLPTEVERNYPDNQVQSASRLSHLNHGIAELEKISEQLLAVFAR